MVKPAAAEERPTVLVVEDEFIIALDLSETVRDLGYKVDGPYADTENALVAIDRALPDLAILDVNTADGEVYPLADSLSQAGVPIIFHSGHITPREVSQRYPHAQACSKPCPPAELIDKLEAAAKEAMAHH